LDEGFAKQPRPPLPGFEAGRCQTKNAEKKPQRVEDAEGIEKKIAAL
jgi:hypothetical protein